MGNGSCNTVNTVTKKRSIHSDVFLEKKSKMTTFTYIQPLKYQEQDVESISEDQLEVSRNAKLKIETQQSGQTEFSTKKKIILGTEDEEGEVRIKKVRIKWDRFIKLKKKKFLDDYRVITQIGKGGFGHVYKVMSKSGILRAAKSIQKYKLQEDEHESLLSEMAIMMSLDHPNIARLYEVYDQKFQYVMVMELCDGGQLLKKILQNQIDQEQAVKITKQILSALNYLHSRGIVHRDIKPENLLFQRATKLIKLIDFGISVQISKDESLSDRVGTPYYIAPEVLYKKYNEKCDMWSVGIVLYMMLSGSAPFKGTDIYEVMEKVINYEVNFSKKQWKKFSAECLDFLKKLLTKNIKLRLSARRALNHPWIVNSNEKKINFSQKGAIIERMGNFKFENKLEAVVYTYIVCQLLSSEEKYDLIAYFKDLDKNKNGVLEVQELRYAVNKNPKILKGKEQKIRQIMNYIDTNCSGKIDYTQFLVSALDLDKKITKKHFQQAFSYFDIDNDGGITFSEVSQFLDDGEKNIRELFHKVDENGDGVISQDEFVSLLTHKK